MIVDCALYDDGRRVDPAPTTTAIEGLDDHPGAYVWLGLRMPDDTELADAFERLGIDELDVHEVLSPHSRPVLSIDGSVLHLVIRTARYVDTSESVSLGEMTLVVAERAVVTIRHGHASPLSELRQRLERDPDRLRGGPLGVAAAVIARVISDYRPALDGFEKDVLEVEREVFAVTRLQPVRRLYALKREVRVLLHAVEALEEPLDRLVRHLSRQGATEVVEDLSEASDQLTRTVSRARSLSDLLDAALTASLAQTGVQQNEDMRKISAWVAMAAVPTMVAGIYGMNFEHMPELRSSWGYPLVMLVMSGAVLALYRSFKRSDWL